MLLQQYQSIHILHAVYIMVPDGPLAVHLDTPVSRRCTETSIIACRKRRYMGSLGGALEFAEAPVVRGYPAQWWEEQIAWCGAWDATLYSEW